MPPTLTFEQVGIMVVGLLVLTQWYFGWRADQRAAANDNEPRANPPLHILYVTKPEHEQLKGEVASMRQRIDDGFRELDKKRSSSIAGLHDDLERKVGELRREIKEDTSAVQNRISDVLEKVSELKGRIE